MAGLKIFKKEYEDYKPELKNGKEIEELKLPSNFQLQFLDETSKDFLNLVTSDASELDETNESDLVYLK